MIPSASGGSVRAGCSSLPVQLPRLGEALGTLRMLLLQAPWRPPGQAPTLPLGFEESRCETSVGKMAKPGGD